MHRIPLVLLTGFLGSGKTTLLSRALTDASRPDTAVLINEFGEIGLDHDLIETVGDTVVQMAGGCLCCTIHDNLRTMLVDLAIRRDTGQIPPFRQVMLESTGLADPAPVIHTILSEPAVGGRFRLAGIVTTVDAVNGEDTLNRFDEAVRQVAVADRIVLTKTDLVRDPASTTDLRALEARLRHLNPVATVFRAVDLPARAAAILAPGTSGTFSRANLAKEWAEEWMDDAARGRLDTTASNGGTDGHARHGHEHDHDVNRHGADIRAHCVVYDEPIDAASFRLGVALLAQCCGVDLLRFKAILNIRGQSHPFVVQGSQHVVGAPVRLPAWPSADRRSRIVLILRGVSGAWAERLLAAFSPGRDAQAASTAARG